jgi:hypothetical protein
MPMTAVQFYGEIVVVFDGNAVGKHEFRLHRIAVILLVISFYTHLYTLRDHTNHRFVFW